MSKAGIIITCHNCDYDFEVYRHTIQEYDFIHIDDDLEGVYIVKCPHCGQKHSFFYRRNYALPVL